MYADILSTVVSAIKGKLSNLSVVAEFDGQELTPPCVTVTMEKCSFNKRRPPYYEAVYTFALNYYPSGSTQNADRGEMSEAFYELTEMLSLADGTKLSGSEISSEVKDGVLKYVVSYTAIMKGGNADESDLMSSLLTKEGLN